jgi:MFS family permease
MMRARTEDPSMPEISWLATAVATALAFALGGLWYGPLFGKAWMAEHGFTEEQLTKDFSPTKTYGLTAVLAALSAIVFGIFLGLLGEHSALFAVGFGFSAGLFWVAASIATNYLFERSTLALFLINGGYHVVRFTLMGAAFGFLG